MEESLKKWERWLEQSLRLDTGYPKIMVRSSTTLKEDVSIWRNGDVFEIEVRPEIRNQPERFEDAYDSSLRVILARTSE